MYEYRKVMLCIVRDWYCKCSTTRIWWNVHFYWNNTQWQNRTKFDKKFLSLWAYFSFSLRVFSFFFLVHTILHSFRVHTTTLIQWLRQLVFFSSQPIFLFLFCFYAFFFSSVFSFFTTASSHFVLVYFFSLSGLHGCLMVMCADLY